MLEKEPFYLLVEKGRSIFGYWTLKISTPHLGQVLLLKVLINYPQKTVVSFMLDKGLEGVHYLNNRLRFVSSNNGHFLGLYLNLNDILFWKGERQKHIQ